MAAAAAKRRNCAYSFSERAPGEGILLALPWPPPSGPGRPGGRSLLHCDPAAGLVALAEVDTGVAQREAESDSLSSSPVLSISELLVEDGGTWVFPDWGCFEHLLALPLARAPGLLGVVQLCPLSGALRLRLLRPSGGCARPLVHLALEAALGPLRGAGGEEAVASQACIADDEQGNLVLLRCCPADGSCALHRLRPPSSGGSESGQWTVEALGGLRLPPGREVLRILPTAAAGAGALTLLQYDALAGDVGVALVELREGGASSRLLWSGRWLPGYPNQQIVCIGESCCLVEYTPRMSTLNVGRFDEHGGYEPPMGDWWRCMLPSCRRIRSVWPPVDGMGAVVLLDGAEEGCMALCGLPVDLEARTAQGLWYEKIAGPVSSELPAAVREANWLRRRGVLLLAWQLLGWRRGNPPVAELPRSGETWPLWFLRDLGAREPGLVQRVVSML